MGKIAATNELFVIFSPSSWIHFRIFRFRNKFGM